MSDLIGEVYRETAGRSTSKNTSIVRNGYKVVKLESVDTSTSWRHQLSTLLKGASGALIAGNITNLTDLNVPGAVELLMEEKAPQINFSYGKSTPINDTLEALLPKGSKGSTMVDIATIVADLTSTFINKMEGDENSVPTVFNPWTRNMPAWDQKLHNVKFSYTFNFKMGQYGLWNAKTEVFLPIINLIAPVLPREISNFSSRGPIPGQTALLADSVIGALRAGLDAVGGNDLALNLLSAVKQYTYNINFGNLMRVENCLIDEAKPSFSSDTDEEGYPVAGSVELHFTTIAPYGLVSPKDARAVKFGVNV